MQAKLANRRERRSPGGKRLLGIVRELNDELESFVNGLGPGSCGEAGAGGGDGVVDAQFKATDTTMLRVPSGRERPAWAKATAPNCRGRVDPGPRHYLALVAICGSTVEGIVDTGACRTMMDINTARALNLTL